MGGIAGLALAVAACAGSATFDGRRFEKETAAYRIGVPPAGFERVEVDDQDLAFAARGRGTVSVHALCEGYDDVPPRALRNHLLFGFTNLEYVDEEEWVIDGRGALHTIVDAELDGVPVRAETVILVRSGCVFDLAYVSGHAAPAHAEFERFARAFVVERAGERE